MESEPINNRALSRVEVLADDEPGYEPETEISQLLLDCTRQAAELTLKVEHKSGPSAVTVLLSNDRRLRELNLQFNHEDSVTDVLSFNDIDGWHNGDPPTQIVEEQRFLAPGEEPGLGEIVISVDQTARQAAEQSVLLERELSMLTVHGVLHLLGYDHADSEEERVMFGKTDALLAQLFRP